MINIEYYSFVDSAKTQKDFNQEALFWKNTKNTLKVVTLIGVFSLLTASLSVPFYPRIVMRSLCILSVVCLKSVCTNHINPLEQAAIEASNQFEKTVNDIDTV
jgi:hypothetical protein